ncbi:flavin reductase family protein [Mycobacterium pseudokansasii]|uniref:4-hydroxyphenylacetate 3-monooxygenase reductase component n=1 Tax=Mycobacterium pseudokansasii TaxID=2341080 RepID=A0A498QL71_9MYCO|nr:flavin reductase family protein [Mycobacterium pseudokansasii]VBA49146.1 4-hydroxyphenylacetate 3-monooxygenase reductase component [Mycobacterium pseudokansasii]
MSKEVVAIHDVEVIDESFDDLMTMLDSPVFVVTTQADGHPSGCLVGFATQTSVQPPSFMIGMPRSNRTAEVAGRSDYVAVHLLAQHHRALAELFATQTADDTDKFARCAWRAGPFGMPILDDAVAWFVGRTVSRSDVGDHVCYLLEPVSVWAPECSDELLYLSDIDDLDPGHEEPTRRFYEPTEVTRRYGVRFTLDVP